jgi:hypothetical protein
MRIGTVNGLESIAEAVCSVTMARASTAVVGRRTVPGMVLALPPRRPELTAVTWNRAIVPGAWQCPRDVRPFLAIVLIGADRSEEDHSQWWRVVPSRATRAQRAPLTVIFVGSTLERQEDGRCCLGAVGSVMPLAGDGQCPGHRTGGSPPCAGGAKAELPARMRRECRGRVAPAPARAPDRHFAGFDALPRAGQRHLGRGALRAPLKTLRKVLTALSLGTESRH